ncbi:MAG: hypothetical protein KBA28_00545 [Syntrophaceae bacterium]|jgi:hypothetical protein|nr:hypothetical protein [Syntrophaceae bacterium]HOC60607.1 hypothetical protein [Smithellaceae bacterium]HQM46167.1 hypothetical protein [Smithellaceae bacterium]
MKIREKIKNAFFEILPPTIFFTIAFGLIATTTKLIMRQYGIPWMGFGAALIGGLLVGKVVLVVDKLPFVNKFPDRPLIYNTLWKGLIYFLAALLVHYLGQIIPLIFEHESIVNACRHLFSEIEWYRFFLIQMWLTVLLLVFCALREIIRVIGKDRVVQMFFGNRKTKIENP